MFEHIKQRIIKDLITEIGYISPTSLELIGHNIVSMVEDTRLIHHGINKDYKPCGYTVDSFSNDSMIVAEYSTDQSYFTDTSTKPDKCYQKIQHDIKHAMSHRAPSGPDKIYLISNQEEPASFRKSLNALPFYQKLSNRILIFDARELAKLVFEQSSNPTAYDFYAQFLPEFSRNMDNYEYYGKIPAKCDKHVSEPRISEAVTRHYKSGQSICVLHGLSGSGKTQAAIDYVHERGCDFSNYIWINGEDWVRDTSLSAIKRQRGGMPINVVGIFNSCKTILILDNIERILDKVQFEELAVGFEIGSVVLATSQIADSGSPLYLAIPALSKEICYSILGENEGETSEIVDRVVDVCKSCPLILSTIRRISEQENIPRKALYEECLNTPTAVTGNDGTSIIQRILEKLDESTTKAIHKLANSGSTIFDLDFVRKFTSVLTCHKLQQLSILMTADIPGIVKIHDLICISMRDNENSFEITTALQQYIDDNKGEMTPSVLRQIHLCCKQIKEVKGRTGRQEIDWLTYALMQIEGEEKYTIANRICNMEIIDTMPLPVVMCIIEAKELAAYKLEDCTLRRDYYLKCADEYQKAFSASYQDAVKAELLHHCGKAFRRCQQYENAYQCFLKLLDQNPIRYATYGQIVFLGTINNTSEAIKKSGEKYIQELLENMILDPFSVPLRVSLAAITKLRSYKKIVNKMPLSSVEKLANIITLSALEGIGQIYEAFVSFTSCFGYRYSTVCVKLAESLPEVLAASPQMVDRDQWVSTCEVLANFSVSASREGNPVLAERLSDTSVKFAQELSCRDHLKVYDARAIAKALNISKKFKDALDVILKVPPGREDHWLLYRKAEAQLGLGRIDDALESAQEACRLAEQDPKTGDRLASYHSLISKCHEQAGNLPEALKSAEDAWSKCEDPQYKQELQDRIIMLKEQFVT